MSYSFGEKFKITVFGESHSEAIGIVIDGVPYGTNIDYNLIRKELNRRRPGKNSYSTKRKELDDFEILSGVVDGISTGSSIGIIIRNNNQISKDYSKFKNNPRPSHSDYPAFVKYNGFNDIRGGGQFSGRLTAPIMIAGAIAKSILNEENIYITSHIKSIYNISDDEIDYAKVKKEDLIEIKDKEFPVINDNKGKEMINLIEKVKEEKDSVGGIVETIVFNMPVGVGEPLYDSMESCISSAIFSIPGVRGIEFGLGFDATKLKGSIHNDEYYYDDKNIVRTRTNNHGGVIGGISSGMPIIFKTAIKPTSSIAKRQSTINIEKKDVENIEIAGRHDPCIVPRALPAIEAMTAISILDLIMLGDFYGIRRFKK